MVPYFPRRIAREGVAFQPQLPQPLDSCGAQRSKTHRRDIDDRIRTKRLLAVAGRPQNFGTGDLVHRIVCWIPRIRIGDWKLVREFDRDWELYNIKEDRTELTDLRAKDKPRTEEMVKEYETWADKVGVIDWHIVRQHPEMDWEQPVKPES